MMNRTPSNEGASAYESSGSDSHSSSEESSDSEESDYDRVILK